MTPMDPALLVAARAAIGFMPDSEGLALYAAACQLAPDGVFVEIGTYCGKSTIYLGAAARHRGTLLFTVDHHRGSEENQPGEGYHDPRLVDARGRVDTLPEFRRTLAAAQLEDSVVGVVGDSAAVSAHWDTPLSLLFIDGGHSQAAADADYDGWSPHLIEGGLLLIHDVFPDTADGGRPPYEIYRRALASALFVELAGSGSLRLLRRVDG
jgi:predicted O-methyltransferase YrrM